MILKKRVKQMQVDQLKGRWVLVTGAGSGIGRASAIAFAHRQANLILCDQNETSLKDITTSLRESGTQCISHVVDVASRADMQAFADTIHSEIEAVDILMNNAGVAIGGGFLDTNLDDWDWIIDINQKGVIHGCHFFIPNMLKRGRGGHVINVASAAGYVAGEALAAYATTKFAVFGLSESLREELKRHHIGVTCVCPGIINTPITQAARLRGDTVKMRDELVRIYERRNYTPERVADNILKAVARNRAVAPISPEAWFLYYAKRFFPRGLAWFSNKMSERNRKQLETMS